MEQKIYQVEIKAVYSECDGTNFDTFLFTDRESAKSCVDTLYKKRFDKTENWYSNPFSEYEENEQKHVNERKVIEDGMVLSFELYEDFDCSNLSVMIVEKHLDLDNSHWEF